MQHFTEFLSKEEQIRYGFYKEFFDDAQNAYDFVMQPNNKVATPSATVPSVSTEGRLEDGVYIIDIRGNVVKFIGDETETIHDAAYIGVVMGSHSLKIALNDLPESTLTNTEDTTEYDGYIENYDDAVADWNGKQNTEHIKAIGTNIQLADGEWIPSVAELYLIFLNKRSINAALEFVGGSPIQRAWYWSSTERNAAYTWILTLSDGTLFYWGDKVQGSAYVRAVAAFL